MSILSVMLIKLLDVTGIFHKLLSFIFSLELNNLYIHMVAMVAGKNANEVGCTSPASHPNYFYYL